MTYPTELYCIVNKQTGEIVDQFDDMRDAETTLQFLSDDVELKLRSADGIALFPVIVITSENSNVPMSALSSEALTFLNAYDGKLENSTEHHETWHLHTQDLPTKVWHNPESEEALLEIQAEIINEDNYVLIVTNNPVTLQKLSQLGTQDSAAVYTLTGISGLKFTKSKMSM